MLMVVPTRKVLLVECIYCTLRRPEIASLRAYPEAFRLVRDNIWTIRTVMRLDAVAYNGTYEFQLYSLSQEYAAGWH